MAVASLSLGLEYCAAPDLARCMAEAAESKFQFALVPVVHPRLRRAPRPPPDFTRSEMVVGTGEWTVRAVGKLSPWLDPEAVPALARERHERTLREELAYCRGLGLSAVQLELRACDAPPRNLARILHDYYANSYTPNQIWARVPIMSENMANDCDPDECEEAYNEPWHRWSQFHELMEWHKNVGVLLELTADLPPENVICRWLGEPVKAVVIPTYLFNTNKKGFPVLSRAHQDVLMRFVEQDAQVVISGARRCPLLQYTAYINHLWLRKPDRSQDRLHAYAKGWEDFLQTPLQPLADNLEASTYSVFESDPVKYEQYQKAITLALLELKRRELKNGDGATPADHPINAENVTDIKKAAESQEPEAQGQVDPESNKHMSGEQTESKVLNHEVVMNSDEVKNDYEELNGSTVPGQGRTSMDESFSNVDEVSGTQNFNKVFRVMILGAGRGPLIRAAFNAADICKLEIQVVAVEKNPCALVSLVAQAREVWASRDIEIVSGDMRKKGSLQPADIIVSELLGSWGDNELSPECLDGAARLLRPGGISIPARYTSHAAPISTPRLWAAAEAVNSPGSPTGSRGDKNLENLWVVYMKNKYHIAETKPVFTFTHPAMTGKDEFGESELYHDPDTQIPPDNQRFCSLKWTAQQAGVMHGFSGYFDCELYGGECISIEPSTHSPGMISWFPVFIPIRTPLRLEKGDEIQAMFWRCANERQVWYEWVASVGGVGGRSTPLHNISGRHFKMLL